MIIATLVITVLGAGLGLMLGVAGRFFAVEDENPMVKEIGDMLPQSQCGQCGFPGCNAAAQAVVDGEVSINFCPPGGSALIEALGKMLDIDPNSVGDIGKPLIATVDESLCVGCTKCFKACPTDAVIGATGQIHVVMANACTGCKKCFDICPENCIEMTTEPDTVDTWYWSKPAAA